MPAAVAAGRLNAISKPTASDIGCGNQARRDALANNYRRVV
jgi:hypothetical protein